MMFLVSTEGVPSVASWIRIGDGGAGPPVDLTAPSTPTNLTSTPSAGKIDLTWTASTDDVGVTNYIVRRNGTEIGTAPGTTYTDTTVGAGQTYTYTVQAADAAGNRSAESTPVTAGVPSEPGAAITFRASTTATTASSSITIPTPPHQPGDLLLASVDVRGKPTITAGAGWQLVRDDVNASSMRKATYWRVAGSAEPASYSFTFSGTSANAVGSIASYFGVSGTNPIDASAGQINASSASITAPSVTTVTPNALVVGLFGTARPADVTAPAGTTERSEVKTAATASFPGHRGDRGPGAGDRWRDGGEGGHGVGRGRANIGQLVALRPGTATPPGDTTAPSVPTGLTATPSTGKVDLAWTASTDNVAVTGYRVRRDNVDITPTTGITGTTFSDTTVTAATTYSYTVSALDAATNQSAPSNPATATTPAGADTVPPSVPTGLTATPAAGKVDLAWTASTDNVAVTGYRVRRDNVDITPTTGITGTTFSDTTVTAATTYSYTVSALDAATNQSAQSTPATATTPPAQPGSGITFRAAATGTNSSPTALLIPMPASQAGDVLLAAVYVRATRRSPHPPAGSWSAATSTAPPCAKPCTGRPPPPPKRRRTPSSSAPAPPNARQPGRSRPTQGSPPPPRST